MKLQVGIDMDSVLADLGPSLISFHNAKYGTNLALEDHIDFDLTKIWLCSEEEVIRRIHEFYETTYFDETVPVAGAQDGVLYLKSKYDLHLITSRPNHIEEKSLDWLNIYFPDSFKIIHHTNQMAKKGSVYKTKGQVCTENGVTVIIEDALHNAEDCVRVGVKVFLFSQPWNKAKDNLNSNIKRVNGWEDIRNYL